MLLKYVNKDEFNLNYYVKKGERDGTSNYNKMLIKYKINPYYFLTVLNY